MTYIQSHPARTKYKTNGIPNGNTVKSDEKNGVMKSKPFLPPLSSVDKTAINKFRAADSLTNQSSLLTHRNSKVVEQKMADIVHERAVRESQLAFLAHRDQQPINEEPPITQLMMSNDRRIRLNYETLQNAVMRAPTQGIQQECMENIHSRKRDC